MRADELPDYDYVMDVWIPEVGSRSMSVHAKYILLLQDIRITGPE